MPESAPWLVIRNPASGRAHGRDRWPAVDDALKSRAIRFETIETGRQGDGEAVAREAIRRGHRRLLVAGGDGSVHDVVNGIMTAGAGGTRGVTLAVAPLGTANDWARSLGISGAPAALADILAGGRTMRHDVGVLDFPDAGPRSRRWFINVAGAGYDADVIRRLPAQIPSRLAYLSGALGGLARYRSPEFRIVAGDTTIAGRLLVAFVANGQYCGNRMHVAPMARLDDGIAELIAVRELGLARVLPKLWKLYRGRIIGDPAVCHARGQQVRIESVPSVDVEADGQIVGSTPVHCSIEARCLSVAIP